MRALERIAATATPEQVAKLAAQVAREAAKDPRTRTTALQALAEHWQRGGNRPDTNEAHMQGRYLRHMTGGAFVDTLGRWAASITMAREPAAVGEVVSAPWRTVAYRAGDCDDLATAAAAFAAVVGLPSAIALRRTAPGFAHVVAVVGDSWLPTDRGRLSHVIDFDGATVAPLDLLTTHQLYPVSAGL